VGQTMRPSSLSCASGKQTIINVAKKKKQVIGRSMKVNPTYFAIENETIFFINFVFFQLDDI
jgi:hypothetical protein